MPQIVAIEHEITELFLFFFIEQIIICLTSKNKIIFITCKKSTTIKKLNKESVKTDEKYSDTMSAFIPGTTCEITVKRQNGSSYYDVTYEVIIDVLK